MTMYNTDCKLESLGKMDETSMQNLSSCTNVEVLRATFTWTITNFSFLSAQRDRKIKSAVFTMGDNSQFKWRLRLYPNGCDEGSDTHISLFLQMVSPTEAAVLAKFDFAVIKADGQKRVLASHKIRSYVQWKSLGYHELIDRSQLMDARSGLMLNDCLRIVCEVSVCTGNTMNKTVAAESEVSSDIEKNLRQSLATLLEQQLFSDVTLVAGGKRFRVHKAILSVRSPVFAAMFEHDMQEASQNEVVIDDVEGDVLEQLMRFVYTGKAEKLETLAVGLFTAADKYAIDDLKLICERAIIKSLTVGNAMNTLILADRHNSQTLWEQAVNFMRANALRMVDNFAGIVRNPDGNILNK